MAGLASTVVGSSHSWLPVQEQEEEKGAGVGILWGEMDVTQLVSAPLGKACLQPELRESPVTQASRRKSPFAFGNPSLPLFLFPDEGVTGDQGFHKPVYKKGKPAVGRSQGGVSRRGLEGCAGPTLLFRREETESWRTAAVCELGLDSYSNASVERAPGLQGTTLTCRL